MNFLDPEIRERLRQEDPEHLAKIEEGWSWIEMWAGPMDGHRCYHIGPPLFQLRFLDWGVDNKAYIKGVHLIHVYELQPMLHEASGRLQTVYRYQGTTK